MHPRISVSFIARDIRTVFQNVCSWDCALAKRLQSQNCAIDFFLMFAQIFENFVEPLGCNFLAVIS